MVFGKNSGLGLSVEERFLEISKTATPEVVAFLKTIFANFIFSMYPDDTDVLSFGELALPDNSTYYVRYFKDLAWQITPQALLFFPEETSATIERGYIEYSSTDIPYETAWICFKFGGVEYVFDPNFSSVGTKEAYYHYCEVSRLNKNGVSVVTKDAVCRDFFDTLCSNIQVTGNDVRMVYPWYWGGENTLADAVYKMSAYVHDQKWSMFEKNGNQQGRGRVLSLRVSLHRYYGKNSEKTISCSRDDN